MSQQNVEVVRRAFAAFEGGDLDRLRDLVTDDLIVFRAEPDGATSHGLGGFLELTAEWTEGFRDWKMSIYAHEDEALDAAGLSE
jgi:ketosteroid isomerase-like protein